jgi:hypothetical protein
VAGEAFCERQGHNTLRLSLSAPTPERIEAGVALALPCAPNRAPGQRPGCSPGASERLGGGLRGTSAHPISEAGHSTGSQISARRPSAGIGSVRNDPGQTVIPPRAIDASSTAAMRSTATRRQASGTANRHPRRLTVRAAREFPEQRDLPLGFRPAWHGQLRRHRGTNHVAEIT